MGLNKVEIQGKLGQDPDLRYTPSGVAVCKFSIAVTDKYKDKHGNKQTKTYWARVVAWGNQAGEGLAGICSKYLVKGQECIIVGKLQMNSWEKDGVKHNDTEILASEMHFSGSAPQAKTADNEDDIPF